MTKDVFDQLSLTSFSPEYQIARTNMLKQQIRAWDVLDDKILSLFYKVPREEFVPQEFRSLAFADLAIPLSHGQSMMPPREEARILQELTINEEDKILLLGTDSGFLLVLLSLLGKQAWYVDNHLDEIEGVKKNLSRFGIENITCLIGSMHQGWQELVPFNVILLTGSLPYIPEFFKKDLALNGRLFAVRGQSPIMEAMIVTRVSETNWNEKKIFETERPRLWGADDSNTFVF
jgi:protein-L-isoaspartate(D-aspartate) O-methyltransferase